MRAIRYDASTRALELEEVDTPKVGPGEVLVRVLACGVCRTDLHLVDAELPNPKVPVIPGHEIVGDVVSVGPSVTGLAPGERVGIPWLGHTCGTCAFCRRGEENLCERAGFTGYTLDGGYAEYARADARYCFPIPPPFDAEHAAPLMCAGLIGYRSLRFAGDAERLGLYGFGAAAHIVAQVAIAQGRRVYAFVRPGDARSTAFAERLGASWVGGSDESPPEPLDAAILYAPVGALVPAALKATRPGGRVVCAGIHMSDIPTFAYELLWRERHLCSVANLTRQDGLEFLPLAAELGIETTTVPFPLEDAAEALAQLRAGEFEGAAVLVP